MGGSSAKRRWGIVRTFVTRWRRRVKRKAGGRARPTTGLRCCTTLLRIFRSGVGRLRDGWPRLWGKNKRKKKCGMGLREYFLTRLGLTSLMGRYTILRFGM